MNHDDMARELNEAGWFELTTGRWWNGNINRIHAVSFENAWKELAQQRAQGTVTTPVVGEEETT